MADLRPCSNTEAHDAHQWTENVPTAPLGKHFHHCHGVDPLVVDVVKVGGQRAYRFPSGRAVTIEAWEDIRDQARRAILDAERTREKAKITYEQAREWENQYGVGYAFNRVLDALPRRTRENASGSVEP